MCDGKPATLLLSDNTEFKGKILGNGGLSVGEVVFNTAMTGYQEIISDPSYAKQIVCLTSSHIGNTGTNSMDEEASTVYSSGVVIRSASSCASNWRNQESLNEWLIRNKIVAISDIDTRRLTRHLKKHGAKDGVIYDMTVTRQQALDALNDFQGIQGMDLASCVTTDKTYEWSERSQSLIGKQNSVKPNKYKIVAYDFGIKRAILNCLVDQGCTVQVVPAQTTAQEVMALKPDGVVLSNGPGDPEPCDYAIQAIRELLDYDIPLFGICLGHQLLGLACGAKTIKMKFGHHGANHPVLDLHSGKVMITSQNHSFCIDNTSLPSHLKATHKSLFDGSLQGIAHTEKPAFGFQGHPEASPGPHDIVSLFDQFIKMIKRYKS